MRIHLIQDFYSWWTELSSFHTNFCSYPCCSMVTNFYHFSQHWNALKMFPSTGPTGHRSLPKKLTYYSWKITLTLSLGGTTDVGLGHLIVEVSRSHSIRHTHLIDSSEQVISSLQRLLPIQHTTDTSDKHPWPQWDSNLQPQQSSSFRPILYTMWSPELIGKLHLTQRVIVQPQMTWNKTTAIFLLKR